MKQLFYLKKYLALVLAFVLVFACPILSFADEKTQAEKIQEALLNGETPPEEDINNNEEQQNTDITSESQTTEEAVSGTIPLEELNSRIEKINQKKPDEAEVENLRASFEELSTADKLKVTNIGLLVSAEETIAKEKAKKEQRATSNTQSENNNSSSANTENTNMVEPPKGNSLDMSPATDTGTEHLFYIGDKLQQVTLIARYITDDNGDGLGDVPTFTLTDPNGKQTLITSQTQTLEDDVTKIDCTWTKKFFQMDVTRAIGGMWVLSASTEVAFQRSAYLGPEQEVKPYETTPTPEATEVVTSSGSQSEEKADARFEDGSSVNLRKYIPVLKLGLFLFALVGGLIGFMIFSKRKFGVTGGTSRKTSKPKKSLFSNKSKATKKNSKKNTGEKNNKNDDFDPEAEKQTDEEMMDELRREYAERQKLEEAMDDEVSHDHFSDDTGDIGVKPEEHIAVTREDYDDDDSIEDFVDHVGDTGVLAEKEPETFKKKKFGGRFS